MVGFPVGVPFVTAIVSPQYLDISVFRRYRFVHTVYNVTSIEHQCPMAWQGSELLYRSGRASHGHGTIMSDALVSP